MKLKVPFMSVTNYHINKADWINRKCSKMLVLLGDWQQNGRNATNYTVSFNSEAR